MDLREPLPHVVVPDAPDTRDGPAAELSVWFAAARAGDEQAFASLFRRFAPIVHGTALSRVGPSDADDVVQDTFIALHRALPTLRDAAVLCAWLRTVATNAATDRWRRRARAPVREPLVEREARPLAADDRQLRLDVLARIQELPEAYRETLVWRLVEGLSGPEIAERTGLQPGSVRINLHRGMALLRERLAKDGWDSTS